ncbi:MAG: methyltransferase domain-containing protein [bacterium]
MAVIQFGKVSRIGTSGCKYGPVKPAAELKQRIDNSRLKTIALGSCSNISSGGLVLNPLISQFLLSESDNPTSPLILDYLYPDHFISQASRHLECLSDGERKIAKDMLATLKGATDPHRNFYLDRMALIRGENIKGATSSFADIKVQLKALYKEKLAINEHWLNAGTRIAMSSARLFSLTANLIFAGLKYGPQDSKVFLNLAGFDNAVTISVINKRGSIPDECFNFTEDGLIRLFSLEETGIAEAWDMVGISDGTIEVDSVPDKGATVAVHLPAINTASAVNPNVPWKAKANYRINSSTSSGKDAFNITMEILKFEGIDIASFTVGGNVVSLGPGANIEELRALAKTAKGANKIIGIDFSRGGIRHLENCLKRSGEDGDEKIELRHADAADLKEELPDRSVRFVFSALALVCEFYDNFPEETEKIIGEIHRILEDGGLAVIFSGWVNHLEPLFEKVGFEVLPLGGPTSLPFLIAKKIAKDIES